LILPLLAMMFIAMGIRINAYGITENRYFVLAAGLWVTGSMLYLIISKEPRNVYLPASLPWWQCYRFAAPGAAILFRC